MDWQPISTAPTDGRSEFLLYQDNHRMRGEKAFVGRWDTYWKCWMTVPGAYQRKPTHWMPLPPPPGAA